MRKCHNSGLERLSIGDFADLRARVAEGTLPPGTLEFAAAGRTVA
jgi:hypothetical protein